MTWAALLPLILEYGIPVAEKLWALAATNSVPTQADWDTLRSLGAQTARTQMMGALVRAGIDPASPQGKALLALSPP